MNIYPFASERRLGHVLLLLAAIATSSFSQRAVSQTDFPGLLVHDSRTSQTVSVNQLLSSDKALRSAARARQLLVGGRIDKAQKAITAALKASPDCAIALDIQAAIHLRTGQFDDAAREFQKAINADPTIGQAYVGLGILLIIRKQYKQALIPLDRAESLLPSAWLVYFETAIANLALGDTRAALQQIRHAEMFAATDPKKRSATAYVRALVSIKMRDFRSATTYMTDVIKFNPHGPYAKPALAGIEQMKPFLAASRASVAVNSASPALFP